MYDFLSVCDLCLNVYVYNVKKRKERKIEKRKKKKAYDTHRMIKKYCSSYILKNVSVTTQLFIFFIFFLVCILVSISHPQHIKRT